MSVIDQERLQRVADNAADFELLFGALDLIGPPPTLASWRATKRERRARRRELRALARRTRPMHRRIET